ncbi:type II secretion system GspH family protein [Mesobacillus subterraneus]|uniref:type II secretion system protein n=1 Tax=Mesobacillus subterraneus TaxID=285983 RepID=UPI00203CD07B|nr:type II secretion system protein [Mesobacillus subterraneus]MCM3572065.1 type II secretion system GspH family protein [Mesobacillus subterraneus]
MLKAIKKKMKDQRGLTLVELLAVVVILGIISAIAVPSIGGLIDNSKKDAHVGNAQQMVNAAKLATTADQGLLKGDDFLTLEYLISKGYLETIKNPDKEGEYLDGDNPSAILDTAPATGSYVKISNGKVVSVKLVTAQRGVQTEGSGPILVEDLKRDNVKPTPAPTPTPTTGG